MQGPALTSFARTSFTLRRGAIGTALAICLAIFAFALPAPAAASAKSAALVMDAHTGKVLYSRNADEYRYPASLTKVMTLYLLFEKLEAGDVTLKSRIKMTPKGAGMPPSKLGLRAGETLTVEEAILALITRSANDVASATGAFIAGTEDDFAVKMTKKARALGMSKTTYKNASGLPDRNQRTTARDQATLAKRIKEDFPQYYAYFSTEQFEWRKARIQNHNRLLGRYEGTTGLKTGYTRASGFNLISNVKRAGRHIVAVVMGGKTGAARDEHMRDMIAAQIRHAHAGPRTTPRFVEAPVPLPRPSPATATAVRRTLPVAGSDGPIERKTVRVVPVGKNGETISEGDDNDEPSKTAAVHSLSSSTAQTPMPITPAGVARR